MAKTVKLYTTPTCPYCIKLKNFQSENNIQYENIDVSSNQAKVEEMIEKTGQMGVPAIDIDGEIIVGFDKEAISKALGI